MCLEATNESLGYEALLWRNLRCVDVRRQGAFGCFRHVGSTVFLPHPIVRRTHIQESNMRIPYFSDNFMGPASPCGNIPDPQTQTPKAILRSFSNTENSNSKSNHKSNNTSNSNRNKDSNNGHNRLPLRKYRTFPKTCRTSPLGVGQLALKRMQKIRERREFHC